MQLRQLSTNYRINGQPIPGPDPMVKVDYDSLADENSGRTQDGVMHITWVRRKMVKVALTFSALTREEAGAILQRVQGEEFSLTYLDPIEGQTTKNVYCSNSSSALQSAVMYGGLWRNVTFNCIEK